MQFVVFEKINKCLFIPNCTGKIMRLRMKNVHKKFQIAYYSYAEAKRAYQVQT